MHIKEALKGLLEGNSLTDALNSLLEADNKFRRAMRNLSANPGDKTSWMKAHIEAIRTKQVLRVSTGTVKIVHYVTGFFKEHDIVIARDVPNAENELRDAAKFIRNSNTVEAVNIPANIKELIGAFKETPTYTRKREWSQGWIPSFREQWRAFLKMMNLRSKDIAEEYNLSIGKVRGWSRLREAPTTKKEIAALRDLEQRFDVALLLDTIIKKGPEEEEDDNRPRYFKGPKGDWIH